MGRILAMLLATRLLAGCAGSDLGPDGHGADLSIVPADLGEVDGGLGSFVQAAGPDLVLDGKRFRFVGANRYDLASFPPGSGKFYCGHAYSDEQLDQLVGELSTSAGATVLRLWGFQSFTLGGADWSSLDRVIAAAKRRGLRIILTLENEWKDCTTPDPASSDGRKSASWFQAGYLSPLGADALSYRDYVRGIVGRYRAEPTIAMWQLMNEAESSDGTALEAFVVDLAALIKAEDPYHLLSIGTIGTGQAGVAGAAYERLHAIAGVDVVEAHDYGKEALAMPGAPSSSTNSIYADVQVAARLGKPFFVGEAGIAAPSPMYPFSQAERAQYFDAKVGAHWLAGTDGFLVWSFYALGTDNWQGWDFGPSDPLAAVLKTRAAEVP